jgi:hypothetical protein
MGLLRREPVRVYLYSVLVAVLALLLAYGLVEADKVPLWLGLAASVLAVEGARSKVTPVP